MATNPTTEQLKAQWIIETAENNTVHELIEMLWARMSEEERQAELEKTRQYMEFSQRD